MESATYFPPITPPVLRVDTAFSTFPSIRSSTKMRTILPSTLPSSSLEAPSTPPRTPVDGAFSTMPGKFSSPRESSNWTYALLPTILGNGTFAKVHLGHLHTSPGSPPQLVAIKRPLFERSSFHLDTLLTEAQISSFLPRHPNICTFYGFDPTSTSLIFSRIPGPTLANFSRGFDRSSRGLLDSSPVMGFQMWLTIARGIISAMTALKSVGIVHGDLSWNNVIMRDGLEPVVIDFSSSHRISGSGEEDLGEPISAVTTGFCAPELLMAFISRRRPEPQQNTLSPPPSPTTANPAGKSKPSVSEEPCPRPTFASDVYSIGMTLLSCAIGEEVYKTAGKYEGIYAREGSPMEWVRNGDMMMVVRKGGMVEKGLKGCFGKTEVGRWGVEELGKAVEGLSA